MKGKTLKPSVVGKCNAGGGSGSSITIIGSSKVIAFSY